MKAHLMAITLVACSSPPAKPTTTAPDVDVASAPLDASPAIVEASAPDAELEGRMPACLDARFVPMTFTGDAILMCADAGPDPEDEPAQCAAVSPDGSFVDAGVPPSPLETTFTPALTEDQRLRVAAVDPTGARVTVVIEHMNGPTVLEVWDLGTSKRIATTKVAHGETVQPNFEIAYLGDAILVTIDLDAGKTEGQLWAITKGKLKRRAKLAGVRGWAALDTKRAAFILDEQVHVVALATGKTQSKLDWPAVVADVQREEWLAGEPTQLRIGGDATRVAVMIANPAFEGYLRLAVFPLDGSAPALYPLHSCGYTPKPMYY